MDTAVADAAASQAPGGSCLVFLRKSRARIVEAIALIAVILNIAFMIIGESILNYVVGSLAILVGILLIYQEEKLEDLDSLKTVQNDIRTNANDLALENKKLGDRTGKIKEQMIELEGTEIELEQLAKEYGSDVDTLVKLVERHKRLVDQTTRIIEDDIYNDIMKIVVKGDRDRDGIIDEREIKSIIRRINMDERYTVNEELLKEKVKADPSLRCVMRLVKDLRRTDISEHERVFHLNE